MFVCLFVYLFIYGLFFIHRYDITEILLEVALNTITLTFFLFLEYCVNSFILAEMPLSKNVKKILQYYRFL